MRLRDWPSKHFTYGDLFAIVTEAQHGSAIHHALHSECPNLTDVVETLRLVEYNTRLRLWQAANVGNENPDEPPEALKFPWHEDDSPDDDAGDSMTIEQAREARATWGNN